MLQMLRKRLRNEDEGFTLIELMVVVLIIAILLAIAIPTFLGARARAQNRAAESNLRNALTATKTGFTDNQSYYGAASTASLSAIEPSLSWVTVTPTGGNTVQVQNSETGASVCLLAKSASGTFYGIFDETSSSGWVTGGTYYAGGSSAPICPSATFTTGATSGWYSTPTGAGW